MGATLTGTRISDTYDSLLKATDNGIITSSAKQITDGVGTNTPLYISTSRIGIGVSPTTTFQVAGNSKIGGDLTVTGNLLVEGTTTTVDTDTLSVKDPLIIVGNDNNTSDLVDLGFYGLYDTSGSQDLYAGLYRSASDTKFHLFKDLQEEPTTTVNTSGTGYTKADLVIGNLETTQVDLGDSEKIRLGDSQDLEIFYASGNSFIEGTGTDGLILRGFPSVQIKGETFVAIRSTANENMIVANANGAVSLYYDATSRLQTTSTGVNVTGLIQTSGSIDQNGPDNNTFAANILLSNATNPYITISDTTNSHYLTLQALDGASKIDFLSSLIFEYGAGNTEILRLSSTGADIIGTLDVDDVISVQGSGFGRIEVGGASGGYIDLKAPNSDDYDFRLITSFGGAELYSIDTLKFYTGATTDLAITIDASQDVTLEEDLILKDAKKIKLGNSQDLEIYHNGSHSYIDNGATDFYLRTTGNGIFFKNIAGGGNEHYAKFISNGAVELYYDAVKKFETTSAGVSVTGKLLVGTTSAGYSGVDLTVGDTTDSQNGVSIQTSTTGIGYLLFGDGTGASAYVGQIAYDHSNNSMQFDTAGIERMRIDSSGTITGTGTYTAGSSIKIFEAQRSGGAVAGDWSYDDATTDMSLGTSTSHSFSLKTGNTRALTIDTSQNATFAGNVDVNGTEITVGTNNSIFAENNIRFKSSGAAFIDHNTTSQSIKFRLSNSSSLDVTPLEITPTYLVATGDMYFADNNKIRLGAGNDLQIYSDGTVGYIKGDDVRLVNASGENIFRVNGDVAELYYNDSKKLETTSSGVTVTGGVLISNDEFYKAENTSGTSYKIAGITSGNVVQIGAIDYTSAGTIFAGGDNISITTGGASGTTRMKIDSSGNVGIGTSSPSVKLDIVGSDTTGARDVQISGDSSIIGLGTSGDNGPHGLSFGYDSSQTSGMSMYYRTGPEQITFEDSDDDSGNKVMVIGKDGNVGIGTTLPDAKLSLYHATDDVSINVNTGTGGSYPKKTGISFGATSTSLGGDSEFKGGAGIQAINTASSNNPTDLAFWTTSGGSPTERMRIDSSGNVGIGLTDTSSVKLGVSGNSGLPATSGTTQTGLLRLKASNNATLDMGCDHTTAQGWLQVTDVTSLSTEYNLLLQPNGGNLGIGTTSPVSTHRVTIEADSSNGTSQLYLKRDSTDQGLYIDAGAGSAIYNSHEGTNTIYGRHIWQSTKGTDTVERMRIESSGNVGIGTTMDINKLDVAGNINVQGGNGSYLTFNNGDANIVINNNGSGRDLSFKTYDGSSNSERMRIDKDGNVGIGTTSPTALLDLGTSIQDNKVHLYASGNDKYGMGIRGSQFLFYSGGLGSGSGGITFGKMTGTTYTENMRVTNDGNVGIGTNSPSDYNASARNLVVYSTGNTGITIASNNTSSDGTIRFADGTGGTAGYRGSIQYSHGGDFMNFNTAASERMRIDSSGNLALGTTITTVGGSGTQTSTASPTRMLFDNDYSNGYTDASLKLYLFNSGTTRHGFTSGPNYDLQYHASGHSTNAQHSFYTNNNFVMRVGTGDTTNVGIGTTAPAYRLDVGDVGSAIRITGNGTGYTQGGVIISSGTSDLPELRGQGIFLFNEGKDVNWYMGTRYGNADEFIISRKTGTSIDTSVATSSNAIVTINNSENVGIGTTSPLNKLFVTANTAGDYAAFIENTNSTNGYGLVARTASTGTSSYAFAARAASSDIFVVRADGRVGIGTTSPSYKLHVGGSAQVDGTLYSDRIAAGIPMPSHIVDAYSSTSGVFAGRFVYDNTSASDCAILVRLAGGSTSPSYIDFIYGSVQTGSITTNGSTTAYNTSSDYRLKENVVEMTGALDRVSQLKPSRFNFISDADTTVDGFLAHEVQDIVPEAITGEKDAVDEEGNAIYQGIDQAKLVPLLVGAIQELKAEIEQLKTQINK